MRKITFIDPADQLYEFSTTKRSVLISAREFYLSISEDKLQIRLAMHVKTVRWEEMFDYYHTIVPLRFELSSVEKNMLEKLGDFSAVDEYRALQLNYRELRRRDPDELKKQTETIRI